MLEARNLYDPTGEIILRVQMG